MNVFCTVLSIVLATLPAESCIIKPVTTPAPTPTPTTAPATTPTTAPTTTQPKYECPIGGSKSTGETCVGGSNVLSPDGVVFSVANPIDCNKKCEDFSDSKCRFWSYIPTRDICFLLSSCEKKPEEGTVSGEKGCIVPSQNFTVFNLITPEAELTDCKAKWEPTDACPEQEIGTGGKIPKAGSAVVTYFTAPPSIGCTKITEASCKWGAKECKTSAAINVPIPNLFVKTVLPAGTDCEIATTPKILT